MPYNRGTTKSRSSAKASSVKSKNLGPVRHARSGKTTCDSKIPVGSRNNTSGSPPESDEDEAGSTADDEGDAENDSEDEAAPPIDTVEMHMSIDFPVNDPVARQQREEITDQWVGLKGAPGTDTAGLEKASTRASVSSPEPDFEVADDDDDYNGVYQVSESSEDSRVIEKEFEEHFLAHGDEIIDQDNASWERASTGFGDFDMYGNNSFGYGRDGHDPCMSSLEYMRKDAQPGQQAILPTAPQNKLADPFESAHHEHEVSVKTEQDPSDFKTPDKRNERNALDEHLDRPNKPLDSTDSDTDIEPVPETTVSSPGVMLSNSLRRLSSKSRKSKSKSARDSGDENRSRRPELKRFVRRRDKAYAETVTTPAGMKQLRFRFPISKMDTITLRRTKTTPSRDHLHAHPAFLPSINARLFQEHYFRSPNTFSSPAMSPRTEFENIVMATGRMAGVVGQPLSAGSAESFMTDMDFDFDEDGIEEFVDLEAAGVDIESLRSAPILATPQSGMELTAALSQDSDGTPVTPPSIAQRCIEYQNASPEQLRDKLRGLAQAETTLTPDIGKTYLEETGADAETPSLETSPKRKRNAEDEEMDTLASPVKRSKP